MLINGQYEEQISARNRALQYGDGLFETLAVVKGQALAWDRHIERLQHGCERLKIKSPDILRLQSESLQLCEHSELAVLKLIISRGEGGRAYRPAQTAETTRIVSLHDWPDYPPSFRHRGIEVSVCNTRMGHSPALAGIKHLNRLEQVLISEELCQTQKTEGLALDIEDKVIEGSMSNVFIVKNGLISTPALDKAGVAGVIRGRILELCEESGFAIQVTSLCLDDVFNADEVFFCNSIAGIWPANKVDDVCYEVGPYTQKLQKQLVEEKMIVIS
jgi:4-amino-4-deoxychorismate lyase